MRREELAQIAGIGLTWYTWLEQGKDIQVSTQVLESLATPIQMNVEERNHLYMLALGQLPVEQTASYVTDQRWDLLLWNKAAVLVFGDFEAMDAKERNAIWRRFASSDYRKLIRDDAPELKLTVYRPLAENDTAKKMAQLMPDG